MAASTLAISRTYTRSTVANSVTWFAFAGMLLYTALTALDARSSLAAVGIHLNVAESLLYVIDNPLYLCWGVFLPFVFISCPIAYPGDLDLLVAPRSHSRTTLWNARLVGVFRVGLGYAAGMFVTLLVINAPGNPLQWNWSNGYQAAAAAVAGDSSGSLPQIYGRIVDNGYLYSHYSSLGSLALQVAAIVLALLLIGTLSVTLAAFVPSRGVSLALVAAWVFSGLVLADGVFGPIYALAPLVHALVETRSAHFPYAVSFAYFAISIGLLSYVGRTRLLSIGLG